ncbi:MAG: dienelactone hydrolase family protein [Intrasporangium sp.]|uniref:dienelactone hydrolase family protein n=1 Tax=Intrasporangium sp. TaxID=1925024 RepID=UPI003F80D36A
MSALSVWDRGRHVSEGRAFDVYRRGAGPGVVVIHESPGLTPEVVAFGDELVDAGFSVALPHLFGSAGVAPRPGEAAAVVARLCVSREFALLATRRTSPLAGWLRSLARSLHEAAGGPGVGVVGMCVTGGFALAMMVDPVVVAPVLAQPATPLPLGARRTADLGLAPADVERVAERVASGCPVLGVRYRSDWSTGTRFETLRDLLGDGFIAVELDGRGHATLTAERHPAAVAAVREFLTDRLSP